MSGFISGAFTNVDDVLICTSKYVYIFLLKPSICLLQIPRQVMKRLLKAENLPFKGFRCNTTLLKLKVEGCLSE